MRQITKWSREDLEDSYSRLYEENSLLRKTIAEHEIKIKT